MRLSLESELVAKIIEKEIQDIVQNGELCKSQKMKNLYGLGLSVSDIAKLLGVRYNFVYNVISEYITKSTRLEVSSTKVETKKDKICSMFKQGKSNKEIASLLKTNYNYVCKITKELKDTNKSGPKK